MVSIDLEDIVMELVVSICMILIVYYLSQMLKELRRR